MPSPTYELIATATVATNGGTMVFSSIPSTYKDLILKWKTIYNFADGYRSYAYISTNISSSANYNRSLIFRVDANTPNISSSPTTNSTGNYLVGFTGAVDDTPNVTYGTGEVVIQNYANSGLQKTILWESGEHSGVAASTTNAIGFGGTQIYATGAITTVTMGGGADFGLGLVAGSTASLYGLKSS